MDATLTWNLVATPSNPAINSVDLFGGGTRFPAPGSTFYSNAELDVINGLCTGTGYKVTLSGQQSGTDACDGAGNFSITGLQTTACTGGCSALP